MQKQLIKTMGTVVHRYFICDDSGSMNMTDGSLVRDNGGIVSCSRWEEMVATMQFHIDLSKAANAPSDFRFLNQLGPKRVGCVEADPDNTGERALKKIFEQGPSGMTPLCKAIGEVVADIKANEKQLRDNGNQVAVIIITDGNASDGDVAQAMRPLASLPAIVMLRLCTSDDSIVDYWNQVDSSLELQLDILDDPVGESEEMVACNGWLNPGLPLHRMREFGLRMKELDMIDETLLGSGQMLTVIAMLLSVDKNDIPHPDVNDSAFLAYVTEKQGELEPIFNCLTKKVEPWINIGQLKKLYTKPAGCCTIA
jgi:hypothetical protein